MRWDDRKKRMYDILGNIVFLIIIVTAAVIEIHHVNQIPIPKIFDPIRVAYPSFLLFGLMYIVSSLIGIYVNGKN